MTTSCLLTFASLPERGSQLQSSLSLILASSITAAVILVQGTVEAVEIILVTAEVIGVQVRVSLKFMVIVLM